MCDAHVELSFSPSCSPGPEVPLHLCCGSLLPRWRCSGTQDAALGAALLSSFQQWTQGMLPCEQVIMSPWQPAGLQHRSQDWTFFSLFHPPPYFFLLGAFPIVKSAEGLTMGGFRLLWEAAFHLNLEVVV